MAPPTIGGHSYGRSPKAKKTSATARASRLSNRNGLDLHQHRAGLCSYAKVHDVLEANNEDFSFIAVMKKTHQKPDGTYVDERARLVADTYEKHVQERLGQLESSGLQNVTPENLDQCEKNEIFIKDAGTSKQGHVFGLGALHSKVLPSIEAPSNESHASEEVEIITKRLQEVEAGLNRAVKRIYSFEKKKT
ncbi:uncharacterized protein LOC103829045 [Brassica rapa]|uniref:uncharacterized protein LOC103829045 n=1 Tax=Brassica campestris TaxID=3711 RepID=UPI00142DBF09|nr:uncharacterized protein LOC103829045 [Brassica rapa]XP_009102951.2 uncharacterized protein LOC103829045 [Brassica rapa]